MDEEEPACSKLADMLLESGPVQRRKPLIDPMAEQLCKTAADELNELLNRTDPDNRDGIWSSLVDAYCYGVEHGKKLAWNDGGVKSPVHRRMLIQRKSAQKS